MLGRERHSAAIAGSESQVLAPLAAAPDRTDRMDDVAGRQAVALGDFGVAGGAAAQPTAFGQQFGAGGAMNRAIDATAAEQRGVRRIDDGIDIERRDIGDDNVIPRRADLA